MEFYFFKERYVLPINNLHEKELIKSGEKSLIRIEYSKVFQGTYDERDKELKSGDGQIEDKHWYSPVTDVVGKALSPLERPIDLLMRPQATIGNTLAKATEAVVQGEPIWSLGDDALYGAWRGLSGQDKNPSKDIIKAGRFATGLYSIISHI